jgi:uncharacterized protein YcbK (DUF882 family)
MRNMMIGRRGLLGGALAAGMMTSVGAKAELLAGQSNGGERRIAFRNVHTNDTVDARFWGAKGWDAQGLAELNHGLRDWRNNEQTVMDPELMLLLTRVRDLLGVAPQTRIELISGYRSPVTNGMLRERGGEHTGVASKSQHMLGKATDIHMPGIALDRLHMAALSMQAGGVGYYPKDGFVHVDTGRVRHWG